jgi:glyoxylase-like metal-dependent hydrolase (beta-lactamase superfamily II)
MPGQAGRDAEVISEVVPGIFRIIVQIPIPEVGSMNSYVMVNGDRNLIVDPGMAHPSSCEIMEKAIGELGLDMERTDFFVTHHHLDHFGSVSRFLGKTSRVYISRPEAEFIERVASGEVQQETGHFLEMLGFPEKDPMNLVSQFYSRGYSLGRPWPFLCVSEGDVIVRDLHRFTCVVAPGHTIGHTCLYDTSHGVLLSGDQITAGIQFLLDRDNPLADHLQTLARIREMDVKLVLPGHGSSIRDHRKRIDYLRAHHQGRSEAACDVLGKDGKDAYEVTLALDGLLPDRESLDKLPLVRKFIHTRHSFAYLQHLAAQGRARKEYRGGRVLFSRCEAKQSRSREMS